MRNWRYILVFVLGIALGSFVTYKFFPREVPIEKTKVETKVEYRDRTEIQYVPKESSSDADVEIIKAQPKVTASVNGQKYDFALVQGETQKFDKGKLTVDQSSTIAVDVSAQVEQQVANGIKKAFDEQKKKPVYKLGVNPEFSQDSTPSYNLRLSRQSEKYDVDLKVDQKGNTKAGITWWF